MGSLVRPVIEQLISFKEASFMDPLQIENVMFWMLVQVVLILELFGFSLYGILPSQQKSLKSFSKGKASASTQKMRNIL